MADASRDGVTPGSVYVYAPNKAAAIFFTVAFAATFFLHLWQSHRYKSFKVTGLLPFCGLLFVVGFAVRSYGSFNFSNVDVYIASTVLIYMSPPLLELSNYHILGRVLYYVPHLSPTHPGRVLATFGALSALVEILNAIGVMYITNPKVPDTARDVGHRMMQVGLVLQILVVAAFYVLAGIFHRRCARDGIFSTSIKVRRPLVTLYVSTSLILVRTIFRAVEHFGFEDAIREAGAGGNARELNPLLTREWFFYVLEASLMFVNMVLWNAQHPGKLLPNSHSIYLSKDGVTEVEGSSTWSEKPWYIHLLMGAIDPFGCLEILTRKKDDSQSHWPAENGVAVNKQQGQV